MSEPSREHIAAVAAGYDPDAYDDTKKRSSHPAAVIQWAARRHMATEAAKALLTSTDPAVLDAMQDALVRAGRLTESREMETFFDGFDQIIRETERTRLVTDWREVEP